MRTTAATIAAATLGALACTGAPRPAPPPTPAPATRPAPAEAAPAAAAPASRFALRPGAAAYDVRSESTIEMTAGPAAERGRETVTTTARVTYELTAAGRGIAVAGQVDGLAVQASSRVAGDAPPPPPGAVRFRGTIDARGARLAAEGPAPGCLTPAASAQAAALVAARETAVWAPATIAVGTRWRDSATVTTCRGPIGALATVAAHYEVTAIDGPRVRVRRETTVSLRGGGIAGGRTVTLAGSGGGVATLELDATRGRLAGVDGTLRTTITVTLPDGARAFTQQVRTTVVPR